MNAVILDIITNRIVITTFLAALLAQVLKWLLHFKQTGNWDWRWLLKDAGMPSTHTATVTALTLSLIIVEGITPAVIGIGTLSIITIRDVVGDKIFATKQENVLNRIMDRIENLLQGDKVEWRHFTGHTLTEVTAGFILGIVVTAIMFYNY